MNVKPVTLQNRFHPDNTTPKGEWVWVFGSNLAGRHAKGAAKIAHVTFKAQYGIGKGLTGKAYAIPVKDAHLKALPLEEIASEVNAFLEFARKSTRLAFFINRIGCVDDAYNDKDIAPLFRNAPENCCLPEEWKSCILAA